MVASDFMQATSGAVESPTRTKITQNQHETFTGKEHKAEHWINFYIQDRPYEGLQQQSPDQVAREQGLPTAPALPVFSCSAF